MVTWQPLQTFSTTPLFKQDSLCVSRIIFCEACCRCEWLIDMMMTHLPFCIVCQTKATSFAIKQTKKATTLQVFTEPGTGNQNSTTTRALDNYHSPESSSLKSALFRSRSKKSQCPDIETWYGWKDSKQGLPITCQMLFTNGSLVFLVQK